MVQNYMEPIDYILFFFFLFEFFAMSSFMFG